MNSFLITSVSSSAEAPGIAILSRSGPGAATLRYRSHVFPVAIGHGGVTGEKREGDGATPIGRLALRRVFYRADRTVRPVTSLPCEPLAPADGWCDDPGSPLYNRHVTLPHAGRAEALWREGHEYDCLAVLGWNDSPPESGRGSAIFLHLPTASGVTEGCIALPEAEWRLLLAEGLAAIDVTR